MYDICRNAHSQAIHTVPTITFTEKYMVMLLKAYKALRDLENLLTMISEIDPTNGILCRLRLIDKLIQRLSPLFDPDLDYDQQVYTDILENDSLSISSKAHILLGSKAEYKNFKTEQVSPGCITDFDAPRVPETGPVHTADFTVDDMVDLLTAYYGYCSLCEAVGLFAGTYPSHRILCGLSFLDNLIMNLSPLYHSEYDDDEIENAEYAKTLNSIDLSLRDKARMLMGETPV